MIDRRRSRTSRDLGRVSAPSGSISNARRKKRGHEPEPHLENIIAALKTRDDVEHDIAAPLSPHPRRAEGRRYATPRWKHAAIIGATSGALIRGPGGPGVRTSRTRPGPDPQSPQLWTPPPIPGTLPLRTTRTRTKTQKKTQNHNKN